MHLVFPPDLNAGPLTAAQALVRAEAMVAASLCPGLPDLSVRTWVADYRMRNDQRGLGVPLYGRRRLGPSVLKYWPVTGLVSVLQDGTDRTAECVSDSFSVRLDGLSAEFLGLSVVRVTFRTGWEPEEAPEAIRQAILLTAQDIQARPASVASERLGDAATVYALPASVGGLPASAAALLAPWRFVGV